MSQHQPIEHINPALIVVLTLATCGLYSLYLLYRWIIALNDYSINGKKIMEPGLAVLLTLITLGIAGIYFQYEIARQIQVLAKDKPAAGLLRSTQLREPRKNLKEIVLYGNIISLAIAFASSGTLSAISFIFDFWLILEIQSGMEYCFGVSVNDA